MAELAQSDSQVPEPRVNLRDPDFYIEDGNVVLSAKDSTHTHTTYFRLHKGMLARASPIFRDMFTLSSPSAMEDYDGVPLVEMHDDAKDLRELIALLYDPPYISTILEGHDFTLRILGPARLANKYQIEWISKMVASQLEKRWPTTLQEWDAVAEEEEKISSYLKNATSVPDNLRRLPEPVSSILLARECDVTSILPFAFYHILAWPLDPTEQFLRWKVPQIDLLAPEDWRRMFLGQQRIQKWLGTLHTGDLTKTCQRGKHCDVIYIHLWYNIAQGVDFLSMTWLVAAKHLILDDIRACPECKQNFKDQIQVLRVDFFKKFPHFFQFSHDAEME
ncbi:hypothetical protein C8F04DRAFT_1025777 [Mycena alexandri]|uniref:BTB domain-containing protein n=1 Tax=Mycena alexandri TaxID=1745969 RepID=A0AAD6TGJ2_9AGAR|nr:hypothetical protein C8F04DRAFT_1025777 [Mycena alexandri]